MKMDLDKLMPHREPMRLVKRVMDVGRDWAITESVVREGWPLCRGDSVNPVVLVELVAQSATVFLGWRECRKRARILRGEVGWWGSGRLFFIVRKSI